MPADFWSLPSWDQLAYIDSYIEKSTTVLGSGVQILGANNRRIAFFASVPNTSTTALISTSPAITGNPGVLISTNAGYVYFAANQHGPIVTLPWYCTGNTQINTLEIICKGWPESGDNPLMAIAHPPELQSPIVMPKAPGVDNQLGVLSYWHKIMGAIKGK